MEYVVHRLLDGGRPLSKHLVWASGVRGMLTVTDMRDADRHRYSRVARLAAPSLRTPLELLDVTLLCTRGDAWLLTGLERVTGGPLQHVCLVAQTWLMEPAHEADVERLEAEVQKLHRALAELRSGPTK